MQKNENVVNKVLSHLSRSSEAQYYLNHYHNRTTDQWIIIKVSGQVLANQMASFVDAISLLYELGLTPVILHGAGSQIDDALNEKNIPIEKLDGLRVTNEQCINVVESVVSDIHNQLISSLNDAGVNTSSMFNQVFDCDVLDEEKYGYVGQIKSVDMEAIRQATRDKKVPVLTCLGQDQQKRVVNINADMAIKSLVWQSHPLKVIFVTPTGGLLDDNHQLIPSVQLTSEYDQLMQEPWLHSGMKLKIQQIYQLLKPMPRKLSVSITSATYICNELFTHKGQGTFVSMGEHIIHYNILGEATIPKLSSVLETSFHKTLKPDFFDDLAFEYLLMAESGETAALVTTGYRDKPYLNKFAVTPVAQGQGLGKSMWQNLIKCFDQLYWRSRITNPINIWYYQQAEYTFKKDGWIYFSYGMNAEDSLACMQNASKYNSDWLGE